MELTELINHPERLDRDTLYELRSMLALNPYFQTARLLMLQNLYLLHDAAFDEELRRASLYITDRKAIFNMVEAAHYQLRKSQKAAPTQAAGGSRTVALIDTFLDSIPEDEEPQKKRPTKRPTTMKRNTSQRPLPASISSRDAIRRLSKSSPVSAPSILKRMPTLATRSDS